MHVHAISVRSLQKEVLRLTVADGRFTACKDKKLGLRTYAFTHWDFTIVSSRKQQTPSGWLEEDVLPMLWKDKNLKKAEEGESTCAFPITIPRC